MIRRTMLLWLCVALLTGTVGVAPAHAETGPATVTVTIGGQQPIQDGKTFRFEITVKAPEGQKLKRAIVKFSFPLDEQCTIQGIQATNSGIGVNYENYGSVTFGTNPNDEFISAGIVYQFTVLKGASRNLVFKTGQTTIYPVVGAGYRLNPGIEHTIQLAGAQPPVHEHAYSMAETKSPTCTEDGYERYQCDGCPEGYSIPFSATGHDYAWMEHIPALCDLAGEQREQCTVCKEYSGKTEDIIALGHAWDEGVATTQAACETDGLMLFTCTRTSCYQEKTGVIPATGHINTSIDSASATCTEDGYLREVCVLCHKVVKEEIEKTPSHQFPETWEITGDDCTQDRERWHTCKVDGCGEEERQSMPAFDVHEMIKETILAGCETDGTNISRCTRCSFEQSVFVPKLGHDYGIWYTSPIPTCVTDGLKTRTCERCNDKQTEPVPATPDIHNFSGPWEIDVPPTCEAWGSMLTRCMQEGCSVVSSMRVQPEGHQYGGEWHYAEGYDCETGGIRYQVCTVNDAHRREEIIAPGQHILTPWTTVTEATCLSTGLKRATCTVCDKVLEETLAISTVHNSKQVMEEIREQTCTQTGLIARRCKDCNAILFQLETPKLLHDYSQWVLRGGTCEEVRYEDRTCTVCLEAFTREVPAGTHVFPDKWDEITPPGCESEGEEMRACTLCGYEAVQPIKPTLHKWSQQKLGRESTCWEAGYIYNDCLVCDARKEQALKLAEHAFGLWEVQEQNSCLNEGLKTRHCSVQECGAEESEILPQLQHNVEGWEVLLPTTCAAPGQRSGECKLCNTVFWEEIPVLSHTYGEFATVRSPLCGVEGLRQRTCAACGTEDNEAIKQLWHVWTAWNTLVEPGCEKEGTRERTCTLCGVEEQGIIQPDTHKFGKWGGRTFDDCTVGGRQERVCEKCGVSEHRAVEAVKHHFAAWQELLPATCSSTGEQVRECRRCAFQEHRETKARTHRMGRWESEPVSDCVVARVEWRTCRHCDYQEERLTQYVRHYFAAWQVLEAATCHANGLRERTCHRCGHREQGEIKQKKHTFSKWTTQRAATCSAPGVRARACKRCGETEERAITQKQHRSAPWRVTQPAQLFRAGFQSRLCKVCGQTLAKRTYHAPKSSFAVTFSSFGLTLQDFHPSKPESGYMVSPIKLTIEGEAYYPLIADDSHVVGLVVTKVEAGKLTVTADFFDDRTEILKPSLRFFVNMDSITQAELEKSNRSIGFGRTIDIKRSFGDAEAVFLSVRCKGIYDSASAKNPLFSLEGALPDGIRFSVLRDSYMRLAGLENP